MNRIDQPASGAGGKRFRTGLWALALIVLLAGAYGVYRYAARTPGATSDAATGTKSPQGRRNGPPSGPVPVVTAPVRLGDIDVLLDGLGTVTPLRTVTVKSRVDGELMRVLFNEGDMVKAGQLIAQIDSRPYTAQLTEMEGQLARDQALLINARIDLKRYQTLFDQDSIAQQQLETQKSLVDQYVGTVKFDQGQVDNAKLQVVYANITAPVSGLIGLRQVDPGNIVHASDAGGIAVITQLEPISVVFTITQDNIARVMQRYYAGKKLVVEAYDREFRNRIATGAMLAPDNQVDPTTGTVKIKAQFDNRDRALFPQQFVNARMLLDTLRQVVLVPSAAIQRGSGGLFVYVVRPDNTATVRIVKTGVAQAVQTQVLDGLAAGDQVVTEGMDRLREGAQVDPNGRGAAAPGQRRGPSEAGAGAAASGLSAGMPAGMPGGAAAGTAPPQAGSGPGAERRAGEAGNGQGREGRRKGSRANAADQ
jgi:multidrug efflux system membrane fusion protein